MENILFGIEGTFTIGYRAELPEKYSLGEVDYDALNEIWTRALRDLPNNTIFCKHDIFEKAKYDTSHFPNRNYLEKATKEYFQGVEYIKHTCNIFFSLPNKLISVNHLTNPYRPPQKRVFQEFDNRINDFVKQVEQCILYLNKAKLLNGSKMNITPLDKKYMRDYYSYFSRGLDISTQDILKEKDHLQVGSRYVGILKFPTEDKFPEKMQTCIKSMANSNAKYSFFQNYGEFFGFNIEHTHIYCQIAYIDDPKRHYNEAHKNHVELHKARKFDPRNAFYAKETKAMLDIMAKKSDTERIIRGHNNIIIFGNSLKELQNIKSDVKAIFQEMDIKADEPAGDNLLAIYEYSFPLNNHKFTNRHLYVASLEMFATFLNTTGEYRNDTHGTRFNSRLNNTPVVIDLWDENKKYVQARNFFILASTGGGKSFLANHILTHAYEDNVKSVVIDLGGSYKKLTTLFPQSETAYITYKEGEGLGINPFYIEQGEKISVEQLERLADFIGVHYRRERDINQNERSTIIKLLQLYYEYITEGHSLPNFIKVIAIHKNGIAEKLSINKSLL